MDLSEIKSILSKQGEELTGTLAELKERQQRLETDFTALAQKGIHMQPAAGTGGNAKAFGLALSRKLLDDPALAAWKSDSGKRLANRVAIDFDMAEAVKAVIVNAGDTMAPFDRQPGIVPLASRRRWIWEYLPNQVTTAPAVEYLRENGTVGEAGLQVSEGSNKQETYFEFELRRADCETFAHWTQMSRQVFSDQPALAGFVQQRLMQGIWLKLEQQIINGTGTSPQLSGILDSGNFVAYTGSSTSDGMSKVDHIRDAISVLQEGDYNPGLIVVNPVDWKEMELERGTDGQYVWATPSAMQPPTLWSQPVHVTNSIAVGTFIVMDPSATTLWTRQSANMLLSDSHNGTFIQNVLTALCEARFAFGVLRPEAIVAGDYD